MKYIRRFLKRLGYSAMPQNHEQRLQAEIEEHLTLQTEENVRAGLSPAEARRQAVLKFGAVEAMRESYRDQKGLPFLETLFQDIRHSVRRFRKAPAFAFTVVLTLALGIGATTSIFTLVHAVLLKSLPVVNPAELYRIGRGARCCYEGGFTQEGGFSIFSYELYKYLRDNTKGFSELAAFEAAGPNFGVRRVNGSSPAESYRGEFVSGNYFAMFGVGAHAGRVLTNSDDQSNAPPVAVMSYSVWRQRYASDPSVVGGVFTIDGKAFTVVGITPPGFFGDRLRNSPPDLFLPLSTEPSVEGDADLNNYDTHWLYLIGRAKPAQPMTSLEAQMRVELKQWLRSHWGDMGDIERANFPNQTLYLSPGGAGITSMREQYEHWLHILMTVSGFVLVIVCANIANLMLLRGMERRRETSLSMALGAQPTRVVRQALTESILLSLIGGAAGLLIAFAGTRLILHFAFPSMATGTDLPINASPSLPVLLFAFGVSVVTGLAFGIGPAWIATRVDPIEALRGASRSTERSGSLPRKTLVVLQTALSLVLLCASGLLSTTLHRLENQDFGFSQERRLVVSVSPRLGGYRVEQLAPLNRRIQESIASLPQVSSVGLCTYSPLNGNAWGTNVLVDGHPDPGPNDNNSAIWDRVTAGYFNVIGNPILRGRGITEYDTATSKHVAVVNEAFARKFFGHDDPIGKYFERTAGIHRQYEIVGVAKDARFVAFNLEKPIEPMFFLPDAQHDPSSDPRFTEVSPSSHFLSDIVIVTRTGSSLSSVQVHQAIASIDPNLPVFYSVPLKEQVAMVFSQQRLIARLTSMFGILSLVLACLGVYGVAAYNVSRRVNEIGIRMALGADRSHVVAIVMRGAFGLVAFGMFVGLPVTLAGGRFLGDQLYGSNPYNAAVILTAAAALGLSAIFASLIPASRASRISPLEALRTE